jgi:SAM-dependent methyltransferase
MKPSLPRALAVSCLAAVFAAQATLPTALAQPAPRTSFEPQVGQAGKDVIWVPTAQALVDTMMKMAKVTPQDYVIDLGSGDGRTVITAAKLGATAHGIEYNPDMVALSKQNAEKEGVTGKATFVQGDIFQTDFSKATVLTMFLLSTLNLKLRPTILNMKPGTRVVSNSFDMGEWTPDETVTISENCTSHCRAHFWLVPAKVDGTWKLGEGELVLKQEFQNLSGTLKNGNVSAIVINGKMAGEQITFTAGNTQYTGKVNGNLIEGTAKTGDKELKWQATRS